MYLGIPFRLAMSALICAFGVVSGVAYAEGQKRIINAMAVTTYPPFEFADSSGKSVGLAIDILNGMAARMGAEVKLTQSGFDQMISFAPLKTKRADILLGAMADTPERRENAKFIDYVYSNYVFYTTREKAGQYSRMDALCGKRIGAPRVSLVETGAIVKWSEDNCTKVGKPAIIVMPAENTPQVRLMVKQGHADAGLTGAATLAYQNKLEGDQYVTLGKPVVKVLTGMAFSKDEPQFGEELKKALANLIADGTYMQILHKWGLTDDASIQKPMISGQP